MTARLHRFTQIDSTLDVIHGLAAEGAAEGTVVVAEEQLEGRGSRGQTWHSPPGGLWLSVLCRPATAVGVEVLSLRAGLAVAEALDDFGGLPPVTLKWPNDIMLGDRKLGGILCEARWQGSAPAWVAIGLGLNVVNPIPAEIREAATNLAACRADLRPGDLLPTIISRLSTLGAGGPELSETELAAFARRDWLRGRVLAQPAAGIALGVRSDGSLEVRGCGGELSAARAGHVELAASAPPSPAP